MKPQSIVFLDLDGTLLNSEKEILPSTKEAIQQLKANGHIPAIATGRTPIMFEYVLEELGINSYISLNGNYVVYEGTPIFQNSLDTEVLKDFTQTALGQDHPMIYLDEKGMHSNIPEHDKMDASMNSLKLPFTYKHQPDFYLNAPVYQALLFCSEGEEQFYQEKYGDYFKILRWHEFSCDVTKAGSSKALGIEKMIEFVNIPHERQYAFGDGSNDFEMIDMVGHGIVMENGREDLKERAGFITRSCDDDGIYYGLKHMKLI